MAQDFSDSRSKYLFTWMQVHVCQVDRPPKACKIHAVACLRYGVPHASNRQVLTTLSQPSALQQKNKREQLVRESLWYAWHC